MPTHTTIHAQATDSGWYRVAYQYSEGSSLLFTSPLPLAQAINYARKLRADGLYDRSAVRVIRNTLCRNCGAIQAANVLDCLLSHDGQHQWA